MKGMNALLKRLLALQLVFAAAADAAGPAAPVRDLFTGAEFSFADILPPDEPEAEPYDRINYIAPWEVETSVVQPPPAPGSPEDLRDLTELKRWQAERTNDQCAAAWLQEDAGYEAFFGAVSPFARPAPDKVADIFQRVRIDAASVMYLLKRKYQRPRPYLRDINILPCVEKESSYAYPSGHSTVARVFGLMLAELRPAQASVFMAYADQAALNRVIGGVHHPTDTAAGKLLGDEVFRALKKDKNFRTDMDLLRRSLRP